MIDAPPNSFVHPSGICETTSVGAGTRIWAFAHVLKGAKLGSDCNICDHVFIENDVVIGDRVTIKCGVQIWDGLTIGDDVFIGPNATFTNDKFPRSKQYQQTTPRTIVESGASIGANATILPGVRIGRDAMVGAGSVVTGNVPATAVVVGNPARVVRYVDAVIDEKPSADRGGTPTQGRRLLRCRNAAIYRFPLIHDMRGLLSVGNFGSEIPFVPKRYFIVFDVPSKDVRGQHAHVRCEQFLVCMRGSVAVLLDDGKSRDEVLLDEPNTGLFVPAMTWAVQYRYTEDALLLVFASEPYDPKDYLRDYDAFLQLAKASGESAR